ncbi:hypothetical protein ACFY2M_39995 [Streptomyces sp. NPDC001276]|uniref:hypothetical protein n=1 Tax=unclassified Streptomyces TaxID=2593676 RepID=UPI00341C20AB
MPPAATPKMLVSEFARFLGMPITDRLNQTQITRAVCDLLCELGTQLVLIDDVHLLEFTHQQAAEWLAYRHRRWPASTNPYLLVSQKTALDPDQPAISIGTLRGVLPRGVTLDGLRQDRILDEAFASADPLRLMRLFGVTERTAMRYVGTAHPERSAKLPR